jgi:hypothetical protein
VIGHRVNMVIVPKAAAALVIVHLVNMAIALKAVVVAALVIVARAVTLTVEAAATADRVTLRTAHRVSL